MFESIPNYRKIVLLIYFFQNDEKLLRKIGFCDRDFSRLNFVFKKILIEQHEEYLDYVKNEVGV